MDLTNAPSVNEGLPVMSPDGTKIAYGLFSGALWVMDADGQNQRMLTRGIDEQGADHPRWLP